MLKNFLFFLYDRVFFISKTIITQTNNVKFYFNISDRTGMSWINSKKLGSVETSLIKHVVKKDLNTFLYIGAHQGFIAILLSKLYFQNANFYCIEALKYNYELLLKNIKLNNLQSKFKTYNFAISNKNGFLRFNNFNTNSTIAKSFLSTKVEEKNITDFLKENEQQFDNENAFILIDIEGMEGLILNKILEFFKIKKRKPNIFIEMHGDDILNKFDSGTNEIYKHLRDNDYTIYYFDTNDKKIKFNNNIPHTTDRHFIVCSI